MTDEATHFKYTCRICQKPRLQPIDPVPENTPIPKCCGQKKDMAFQGVTTLPKA